MNDEEKKSRPKSKEYPAVTLGQAIEFVTKFKDYPHGKPISYDVAAKECGVSSTTKSFRYTMSAAKQFGLISTSAGLTFTLSQSAYRLIRPTEDDKVLRKLKVECFSNPRMYSELIMEYNGKSIPNASTIENVLVNYHHILPNAAAVAAQKFIDSATEIGVVQNGVLCLEDIDKIENQEVETLAINTQRSEPRGEAVAESELPSAMGEFAAPLNIPFGDRRRAVLYMPMDATKEDAEYVKDMISLMLKRVYKVE